VLPADKATPQQRRRRVAAERTTPQLCTHSHLAHRVGHRHGSRTSGARSGARWWWAARRAKSVVAKSARTAEQVGARSGRRTRFGRETATETSSILSSTSASTAVDTAAAHSARVSEQRDGSARRASATLRSATRRGLHAGEDVRGIQRVVTGERQRCTSRASRYSWCVSMETINSYLVRDRPYTPARAERTYNKRMTRAGLGCGREARTTHGNVRPTSGDR
jgi:hypothetical protein